MDEIVEDTVDGTEAIRFHQVVKIAAVPKGEQKILNGISGIIKKGTIVTLIGPSGSGKSSLLSVCNLLLTPDHGQTYIFDKEIREWQVAELRRKVGLVLQTPTMIPGTVKENLMLAANLHGFILDHPEQYLTAVGLEQELLTKSAHELSGGQKQRVALARTLVNHPDILLLDEVTSALDPSSVKEVEEVVRKVNREWGTTILWVTHNLEQARRVGQFTWLMVQGKVIEKAETASFFADPKQTESKRFLNGEL